MIARFPAPRLYRSHFPHSLSYLDGTGRPTVINDPSKNVRLILASCHRKSLPLPVCRQRLAASTSCSTSAQLIRGPCEFSKPTLVLWFLNIELRTKERRRHSCKFSAQEPEGDCVVSRKLLHCRREA